MEQAYRHYQAGHLVMSLGTMPAWLDDGIHQVSRLVDQEHARLIREAHRRGQ